MNKQEIVNKAIYMYDTKSGIELKDCCREAILKLTTPRDICNLAIYDMTMVDLMEDIYNSALEKISTNK